jgi:hypothetical protein
MIADVIVKLQLKVAVQQAALVAKESGLRNEAFFCGFNWQNSYL